MITWQYFPKSKNVTNLLKDVIQCFEKIEPEISSENHKYSSNKVLGYIRPYLESIGFKVESGRKAEQRIRMPVLFGLEGKLEKSFDVDAYHEENQTVFEVEAGRAVTNYQFLKDFFEACMMYNVEYMILAVRKIYGARKNKDFKKILTFFDALYASGRMSIPLNGILIIGY